MGEVLFSVGDFDVTTAFVTTVVGGVAALSSAVAAVFAAVSAQRSARTAEIARRTADEARFRGQWVTLRRSFDPNDPETGAFPSSESGPYYRVENVGRGPALEVCLPFPGMIPNGQDIPAGWRQDVSPLEFSGEKRLPIKWTGVDAKPTKQLLKPGTPPEKPKVWDLRLGQFVHN